MFKWLHHLKKPTASKQKLHAKNSETLIRVELSDFAPSITAFLGLNALAQLTIFEAATQGVVSAPSLQAKEALADIAAVALQKHDRFSREIRRRELEPHLVMQPYADVVGRFQSRLAVNDWHQHVLAVWLVGGIFEGFFRQLAKGVKDSYRKEAIVVLEEDSGRAALQELLSYEIANDPTLADKLALWGRRLVGDTLLLAQGILSLSEHREFNADLMEPVFTDLTSEHMRRMDSLGLTA
ncbi:ferritin-like domain-containing protein [Canibacter sp. lx-72]|uniref:ferritin-like fold-containing protein n=1 Tax=Canibacter zhuwentaonis TaxID=2837491 RepID=UPI001BDD6FB7|nr:ferritin-like domain-containing protein [Canibacter zhuwentaonis]